MKDNFWVEESSVQSVVCKKRKMRVGKRKIEFVEWGGSRPLIEFLEAIGRDTTEKHSQQEVASLISKYINDKGLASAEKKKKVLCDERLYALFGKKTMSRIKVYEKLEEHFAENHDDSDDELLDSSDEDYGAKKPLPTGQTKKVLKTPKSCFAAIVPENIKLIYLKRSVIQDLLKFPESFEFKIVGSFIRIKSDPNDIYQKNRFQLQQVTGVHKIPATGDTDIEIYLKVSNFLKNVTISMLSDDNFTEEEVEDVRDRIKAGSLSRLTVNELQLKAQVLHVDITNNWIAKEISLLQKRAEHANEKGWQREKFEYLERRKMLQKPSEQETLLLKVPDVVAEELEPEPAAATCEIAELSACSPKSILRGSSDVSSTDASGFGEIGTPPKVISSDSHTLEVQNGGIDGIIYTPFNDPKGSGEIVTPPKVISSDSHTLEVQNGGIDGIIYTPLNDPKADTVKQGMVVANVNCGKISREFQGVGSGEKHPRGEAEHLLITTGVIAVPNVKQGMVVDNVNCGKISREVQGVGSGEKHPRGQAEQPLITTGVIAVPNVIRDGNSTIPQQPNTTAVIELSSDDDDDDELQVVGRNCGENPNDSVWHYVDPQGETRGPFALSLLKRWSDGYYFDSGFRVWKTGQTPDDGLLLSDVLRRTFPS